MKGISVTQVDISGARESACDCKTALCCLHINTHMYYVSLLRTHTSGSFPITSREQRKKEATGREESRGKQSGGLPRLGEWV